MTLYFSPRYWTPAENRVLLLHWGKATRSQLVQMIGRADGLPRSWQAICAQARKLGLPGRKQPWSKKEEALLRKCLGVYPMREISWLLRQHTPYGRSQTAVYMKARKLGLRGMQRGGRRTA